VLRIDPTGIFTVIGGTGYEGRPAATAAPHARLPSTACTASAVTPDGTIYVADTWNNRIRKIDPKTGTIDASAGTGKKGYAGDGGPARDAQFGGVYCLAFNADFSKLYVTDLDNRRIRVIDMKSGVVSLVAGKARRVSEGWRRREERAAGRSTRRSCRPQGQRLHPGAIGPCPPRRRFAGKDPHRGRHRQAGQHRRRRRRPHATLNGPKHLCIDQDDNVIIAIPPITSCAIHSQPTARIVRIAGTGKKGDSANGGEPLGVSFNEPHGVHVRQGGTLYIVD